MIDDTMKVNKFNEKYRSLTDADYVILADSDEFIFCNQINKPVRAHIEATMKDVYFVNLWQVYKHEQDPPLDPEAPVPSQRRHGDPNMFDAFNILYVKPIVVKGNKDFSWTPGSHELIYNGKSLFWKTRDDAVLAALNVSMKRNELLQGAHWRLVDLDETITRRIRNRKNRLSRANIEKGLGYQHFTITEEEIVKEYNDHKNSPIVIADDGLPWWQPVVQSDPTSRNWTYHSPIFEYEVMFDDCAWSWAGHKWFGYDLVRNTRPKVVVELGTHKGTSLFSFCQAAKDAGMDTWICAIDTWQGDKHAGFYDGSVLQEVKKIVHANYAKVNCTLIQKTFDDALPQFADRSIDILHIDGLHTYEAVKHDYETWRGKVREDGIILFHDIVVREKDFGVFKFWDELKKEHRTLQFPHSNGLGVLFKEQNLLFNHNNTEPLQTHYLRWYEHKMTESLNRKYAGETALIAPGAELHALITFAEKANNLDLLKNIADFYSEQKQTENALQIYLRVLTGQPQDVETLQRIGTICLELHRYDDSMQFNRMVLQIDPDNAQAKQQLEKLAKLDRKDAPACSPAEEYRNIQLLINDGEVDKAVIAVEEFVCSYPNFAIAHSDLAVLYYRTGDKVRSLLHYEKAVAIEPDNASFLKNLADFYYVESSRIDDARQLYGRALSIRPYDSEMLLIMANICVSLKHLKAAEILYAKVREQDPENLDVRNALEALHRYRMANPSSDPPEKQRQEATVLANAGLLLEAVAVLENLVEANPDYAVAHNDLGVLYGTQGDLEKARFHYELSAQLDPANTTAAKNLADFYNIVLGRPEDAKIIYTNVLMQQPDDIEALRNLTTILVSTGQQSLAASVLKRFVELNRALVPEVAEIVRAITQQDSNHYHRAVASAPETGAIKTEESHNGAISVIYGDGFYPEDGDGRWTDRISQLTIQNVSPGDKIYFDLACGKAEQYSQFPFNVFIYVGESGAYSYTFESSDQVISVVLEADMVEVHILIESSQAFVPALQGFSTDTRQLSLRFFNLHLDRFFETPEFPLAVESRLLNSPLRQGC